MTKRRQLVEGLSELKDDLSEEEKGFVYGPDSEIKQDSPQEKQDVLPKMSGRVPITIRTRPEIGSALKRASLKRQLDAVEPSTMQDIVDEALEIWLNANGYLE